MRVACHSLSSVPHIRHGFFTREGGVSEGAFAMLNCGYGSGDAIEKVQQNRLFIARALGIADDALLTANQTHSAIALTATAPWDVRKPPEGDAIATNVPGLAVGVLTADCVPILIADTKNKVVAAAHAGWKGAAGGIIEAAVDAMVKLGASKDTLTATIGPAIEQCSYEVGGEFRDRFLSEDIANEAYFGPSSRDGRFMFDLKGYATARLSKAGIASINVLAHDTCLEENRFFSYRRATLRGEPVYGRQLSAIVLT